MNRMWQMLVLCVLLCASTVLGEERAAGPRLSDAKLLACLDPDCAGLEKVIALRDSGQTPAALAALAGFVRARPETGDGGRRTKRDSQAGVAAAEKVLRHQFTVGGIT
ncbi:MAG: hypothetical protein MUC88_25705, partial [Planctomycetes bacterium]|nr:hypothetical protein [Planctomycetota bacterium]